MLSSQFYIAIGIVVLALGGGAVAWNYMVLSADINDDRKRDRLARQKQDDEPNKPGQ